MDTHLNKERTHLYLIKYIPLLRQERDVRNHNDLHTLIHDILDKRHDNVAISSIHNHGVKHGYVSRMDNGSISCPWRSDQTPLRTIHEQVVISNLYLIKYSPPPLIRFLGVFHDGLILEMELQEIHLGIDVEAA